MARASADGDIGLRVLVEPAALNYLEETWDLIDIVAIHGLGAHPDYTWTAKDVAQDGSVAYINWLTDKRMLSQAIPNARIMRYGYDSHWLGENAMNVHVSAIAEGLLEALRRNRISSYRPLIFICHCFGGLVVLDALTRACHDREAWPGIYQSTAGIAFFGTPFRGAGGLNQAQMISAAMDKYSEDQIQENTLKILQAGDGHLRSITDNWGRLQKRSKTIRVECFYELKLSNVVATVGLEKFSMSYAVGETSGCLDIGKMVGKHSLSRDHFGINKFKDPGEEDYQTVEEVLECLAKDSHELIAARQSEAANSHEYSIIEFSRAGCLQTGKFVGRLSELTHLRSVLLPSPGEGGMRSRRKVYVLHGTGGVGKTQLCAQFVSNNRNSFSAIAWLDGSSLNSLKTDFFNFAASIPGPNRYTNAVTSDNMQQAVEFVLGWLSLVGNNKWLLVFDNVDRDFQAREDDPQAYDILQYFPSGDHGSILVTSRLSGLANIGESQQLQSMSDEESRLLLEDRVGRPLLDDNDAKSTMTALDGLPLALALAGNYIYQLQISFAEYNVLYKHAWLRLAKVEDKHPLYEKGQRGLLVTCLISFLKIQQQNETAAALFKLWAFLDPGYLTWKMLHNGLVGIRDDYDPFARVLCRGLQTYLGFEEAMLLLRRYSLAEYSVASFGYSVHTAVHERIFNLVQVDGIGYTSELFSLAGHIIARQGSQDYPRTNNWLEQSELLSHAHALQSKLQHVLLGPMPAIHTTALELDTRDWYNLGGLMLGAGALQQAEDMYGRALLSQKTNRRKDNILMSSIYTQLGATYLQLGKLEESEDVLRQALGSEMSSEWATLDTSRILGFLYMKQGKWDEAHESLQRTLQSQKRTFGPNHSSTLEIASLLAILTTHQGNFEEAELMYKTTLKGQERACGRNDLATLITVHRLGYHRSQQGKLKEAQELYMRAFNGMERVLGQDHPITLIASYDLGCIYLIQDKLDEAGKSFMRTLGSYGKILGRTSSTLETSSFIATIHANQGKLKEAEEFYAILRDRRSEWPKLPTVLLLDSNLAYICARYTWYDRRWQMTSPTDETGNATSLHEQEPERIRSSSYQAADSIAGGPEMSMLGQRLNMQRMSHPSAPLSARQNLLLNINRNEAYHEWDVICCSLFESSAFFGKDPIGEPPGMHSRELNVEERFMSVLKWCRRPIDVLRASSKALSEAGLTNISVIVETGHRVAQLRSLDFSIVERMCTEMGTLDAEMSSGWSTSAQSIASQINIICYYFIATLTTEHGLQINNSGDMRMQLIKSLPPVLKHIDLILLTTVCQHRVSYWQARHGKWYDIDLDYNLGKREAEFVLRSESLACLDGFLEGDQICVWRPAGQLSGEAYFLSTTIGCFATIWGGTSLVAAAKEIGDCDIYRTRNGYLLPWKRDLPEDTDVPKSYGERFCHWISEEQYCHRINERWDASDERILSDDMSIDSTSTTSAVCIPDWSQLDDQAKFSDSGEVLLIGADDIMPYLSLGRCDHNIREIESLLKEQGKIHRMKTSQLKFFHDTPKVTFSATKYVGLSVVQDPKFDPGKSIKEALLSDWETNFTRDLFDELESKWGVIVSSCTYNAVRVKVWDLFLTEPLQCLIMGHGWLSDLQRNLFVEATQHQTVSQLKELWERKVQWRETLQRCVLICLRALAETGLRKYRGGTANSNEISALWKPKLSRLIRKVTWNASKHPWVRFLVDNHETAAMVVLIDDALILPECFNHGISRCSALESCTNASSLSNHPTLLETHICLNRDQRPATIVQASCEQEMPPFKEYIPVTNERRYAWNVSGIGTACELPISCGRLRVQTAVGNWSLLVVWEAYKRDRMLLALGFNTTKKQCHYEYDGTSPCNVAPILVHIVGGDST